MKESSSSKNDRRNACPRRSFGRSCGARPTARPRQSFCSENRLRPRRSHEITGWFAAPPGSARVSRAGRGVPPRRTFPAHFAGRGPIISHESSRRRDAVGSTREASDTRQQSPPMIRFFYNLLFPLALLFFLPGYALKMLRRGNYRNKFGQRLGFYDRATRAVLAAGRQTWLHAVSVGEVMIALKLASKMKEHEPSLRIALTTTTTTGFALARKQAPEWIEVLYTPLDFWPIMRRAFEIVRPTRVVLVEAEVWPNLIAIAH